MALSSGAAWAQSGVAKAQPIQIPVNEVDQSMSSKDVQKVIPLDMRPTGDFGDVAERVGDRAFQSWLKSPSIQNTSLGRTAHQVEQTMKAEVSLTDPSMDEQSVHHKVGFSVLALQAVARMTYTGWVNAELNHDMRSRATLFQITEKVWSDKQIVLSHTANQIQDTSSVGLRWSF